MDTKESVNEKLNGAKMKRPWFGQMSKIVHQNQSLSRYFSLIKYEQYKKNVDFVKHFDLTDMDQFESDDDIETDIEKKEIINKVLKYVFAHLTNLQVEILKLRYGYELHYDEIANILHIDIIKVKNQLYYLNKNKFQEFRDYARSIGFIVDKVQETFDMHIYAI